MATYWEIAAHSAFEMFSWYKYLIVGLVFSRLGFWSGNLFLIAPFPDLCLLVPFDLKLYIMIINHLLKTYEPPHGKTNILHRRKQRRRSASR